MRFMLAIKEIWIGYIPLSSVGCIPVEEIEENSIWLQLKLEQVPGKHGIPWGIIPQNKPNEVPKESNFNVRRFLRVLFSYRSELATSVPVLVRTATKNNSKYSQWLPELAVISLFESTHWTLPFQMNILAYSYNERLSCTNRTFQRPRKSRGHTSH